MYSKKPHAGICDRCNFRYPLHELRSETVRGSSQNNKICPTCWDGDHPQNFVGQRSVSDTMSIPDARPDTGDFRKLFSWSPVGGNMPRIGISAGRLRVTTT